MTENPFSQSVGGESSSSAAATDLRSAAGDFAKAASEQVLGARDRALEVANSLKTSAIEKAEHFKEVATDKAEHLKTAACDKAAHVKEVAQQQWHDTSVRAREFHVTAEDYIRQNPTKTVLGALGVGFLIGLVMRR